MPCPGGDISEAETRIILTRDDIRQRVEIDGLRQLSFTFQLLGKQVEGFFFVEPVKFGKLGIANRRRGQKYHLLEKELPLTVLRRGGVYANWPQYLFLVLAGLPAEVFPQTQIVLSCVDPYDSEFTADYAIHYTQRSLTFGDESLSDYDLIVKRWRQLDSRHAYRMVVMNLNELLTKFNQLIIVVRNRE